MRTKAEKFGIALLLDPDFEWAPDRPNVMYTELTREEQAIEKIANSDVYRVYTGKKNAPNQ